MRLTDRPDMRDLATNRTAIADDGRHEPTIASAREIAEAAAPIRLDPTRVDVGPWPRPARRRPVWGPIGSLLLHLLPLLAILDWTHQPADTSRPIPIQLVIEQPPPPPPPPSPEPPAPKRAEKPPSGRLASDDFAPVAAPEAKPGPSEPSPERREAQPPPAETEARLVAPPLPPPAPIPLPELKTDDPSAGPTQERLEAVAHLVLPPKPEPPKEPAKAPKPRPLQSAWPLPLQQNPPKGARTASLTGPDAVRDEYCAQALSLTMRHIGLLPRSATLGREGETVLSIHVLGDGTINGVTVARSSGYPDIDVRIERMVLEVSRYPPLPTWMGPSMDFTFQMHFPNGWQR